MVAKSKKAGEKKGKIDVGKLKLRKETVKDLTSTERKAVKGGRIPGGGASGQSVCQSCFKSDCCLINPTYAPCV